jgi:hypothetical protein
LVGRFHHEGIVRGAGEPQPLGGNTTRQHRFEIPMSFSKVECIAVIFACIFWLACMGGCVSIAQIRTEELPANSDEDIVITKTNGVAVRFNHGDYTVDTLSGEIKVLGKGKQYSDPSRRKTISVTDSIPLKDIASVEVHHKSPFHYVGPVFFVAGASIIGAFLLIWLLAGAPSLRT